MINARFQEALDRSLGNLRSLRTPRGLFLASAADVATGYNKAWLRDNFYTSLGFEAIGEWDTVRAIWHAMLDIFLKHEDKINWAIAERPHQSWQYIHARYHPETFEEFWEEWGNKQNDAIGASLFTLCALEADGRRLFRSDDDRRIVQKLVDYLQSIEYWHDPDAGVWEEWEEVHASSIAAVVAGLKQAQKLPFLSVPDNLIAQGEEALALLLPRESKTKFADLALLSVLYPYEAVTDTMAATIVENVTYHLARKRGVVRYKNDRYYNKNEDGISEEAEWTFGYPWLAIILDALGRRDEAHAMLERTLALRTDDHKLPELYLSNTAQPNENIPLAWSESMLIVAITKLFPDIVPRSA